MRTSEEARELVEKILAQLEPPIGAGDSSTKYKQLKLKKDMKMSEALGRLKKPLTIQEAIAFNFGKEDKDEWLLFMMNLASANSGWLPGSGFTDAEGYGGTCYIWVPASAELKDPADKSVALGKPPGKPVQEGVAPSKFPAKRTKDSYYTARHQPNAPAAIATVEVGIKAGDILLTHHPGDRFISNMTTSWPTHAGMAISEQWAVDANNRSDGEAVKVIEMKRKTDTAAEVGFFEDRPEGGLVYRYVGNGKASEKDLDNIRHKAAEWAFEQRKKKYRFALRSSKIIDTSKKKKPIVEKRFDKEGKAIGEDGKRLKYYSGKDKAYKETPYHNIYCAELVWRAYRHAGVNIVDPKDFDLVANEKQAVPAIIIEKIEEMTGGQVKVLKPLRLLWPNAARYIAAGIMRKSVHNKFYFCAPYQLASSKLTEKVAQLPSSKDEYKAIDFDDFRKCNIHPYWLVDALRADKFSEKRKKKIEERIRIEKGGNVRSDRMLKQTSAIKSDLEKYTSSLPFEIDVKDLMQKNKLTREKAEVKIKNDYKRKLEKEYEKKTDEEIERVIKEKISDEEIEKRSWEDFKKKNGVKKLQLSVSRPWADAKDEKAVELRFDDKRYNEEVSFPGMAPPFKDTADFK